MDILLPNPRRHAFGFFLPALGFLPNFTYFGEGGDQLKISGGPARWKKVKKGGPYGKKAPIRGGTKVAQRDHSWAPDRSGSE